MLGAVLLFAASVYPQRAEAPPLPSEGTLNSLIAPIARELGTSIRVPKSLGERLVFCGVSPQSASVRLAGLTRALNLQVIREKEGLALEPIRSKAEARKDLMARFWREYNARVAPHIRGDAKEIRRRRFLMDTETLADHDAGRRNTPEAIQRALVAGALMRLEDSAALVVFRRLQSLSPEEVVRPYGSVPVGGRWYLLDKEELREAGFVPSERLRELFDSPRSLIVVRPYWHRYALAWHLTLVLPDAHATLGQFEIEQAQVPAAKPVPPLPAKLRDLEIRLVLNRPKDDFLTLASLAGALPRNGLSFAAWGSCEPVYYRRATATLGELDEEPRRSPNLRFQSFDNGWIGVRANPETTHVATGIEWSRALPLLDAYDAGPLRIRELKDRLAPLTLSQITALGDAVYDYPSMGFTYRSVTEGAGLLRALLAVKDRFDDEAGKHPIRVRDLPKAARGDVEAYLKCGKFRQDFPEWFHPASTFNIGEMVLDGWVKREGEQTVLHVNLKSVQGAMVNEYQIPFQPETP